MGLGTTAMVTYGACVYVFPVLTIGSTFKIVYFLGSSVKKITRCILKYGYRRDYEKVPR
jgi:hypothetical protein